MHDLSYRSCFSLSVALGFFTWVFPFSLIMPRNLGVCYQGSDGLCYSRLSFITYRRYLQDLTIKEQ